MVENLTGAGVMDDPFEEKENCAYCGTETETHPRGQYCWVCEAYTDEFNLED